MKRYLVICWGQIFMYEYTVQFLQTYWSSIEIFKTFSFDKDFFACFLSANRTIVVFEKFFDFHFRWHASISLLDAFTYILSKIWITFSSRFRSSTLSGITVVSRLFFDNIALRNYCFLPVRLLLFEVIYFIA